VTYGDIQITPQGESYAANVLRRHKLIKHFLIDTLGVDEKTAEQDACQMEHVMSSSTVDKLYEYLERQDGYND
jgi:DtxR family Mn-dependent transcriptional regulator